MLNQKFYTIQEPAELMQLSVQSVRNLINVGEIQAVKIYNSTRIPESEVLKNIKPIRKGGDDERE